MATRLAALAGKALTATKNPSFQKALQAVTSSSNAFNSPASIDTLPPSPQSSGTSVSTILMFIDIIFLLVGVILLVAAQSKCSAEPNGDACKNHKNAGIAFTVISSVLLVVILFVKFR